MSVVKKLLVLKKLTSEKLTTEKLKSKNVSSVINSIGSITLVTLGTYLIMVEIPSIVIARNVINQENKL